MTRIFTTLAVLNSLGLLASFAVGVLSKLRDAVHHPDDPTYGVHFFLGLTTVFVTLLVHGLIFTYFLGTGRWVKEVGLAYGLPDQELPRLTRELKRGTFPPALFAMLITIATAAAGAGAHVGAWHWSLHATTATLTLLINGWAFTVEYRALRANAVALEDVMRAVDRIRAERGLASNAEALERMTKDQ
jgi:hypothetical protein